MIRCVTHSRRMSMHTQRSTTGLVLPMVLALGGSAVANDVGGPIRGLAADELQRFADGRTAFETAEDVEDGLGPVFNATSCGACHKAGATGGGSETVETRFGTTTGGVFEPLVPEGGSLVQSNGIGIQGACTFVGEVVPPQATIVAGQRTTSLFGLGLVDAVPDARLIALAADVARRQPDVAGRPNMVTDVTTGQVAVGRFGWKSQVANLLQFAADAYLNELGIRAPRFPNENCPQGDCASLACDPVPDPEDDLTDVLRFHDFMRFLAPPPVPTRASCWRDGYDVRWVFAGAGCAACHAPTLTTGPSPVAALQLRTLHPSSDFLLHDMGSLGDGIAQGDASGGEMRTAPLWGLHLSTTYLHDGRARTIEEAILAHDGQARTARDRFTALPGDRKAALLSFLGTL